MENNMFIKPIYKCGVCGVEHESIVARANCELACVKRKEEEERIAAEAKKKAEQKIRKAEVDKAFDDANKLKEAYLRDYGYYCYYNNSVEDISALEDVLNFFAEL